MSDPQKWIVYADGAISPERAGAGVVAQDGRGEVILLANRTLPRLTCNEAEYAALVLALEIAGRQRAAVEIRMDSEVVVNQMAGRFAVHSAALKPWHLRACSLARALPDVIYTHIPREQNGIADALAAEAVAGRCWRTKGVPCSGS